MRNKRFLVVLVGALIFGVLAAVTVSKYLSRAQAFSKNLNKRSRGESRRFRSAARSLPSRSRWSSFRRNQLRTELTTLLKNWPAA